MNGLSRCGRPYKTFDAALLAAELRTSKGARPLAVVSCDLGDHWHLVPPKSAINRGYSSPDPFPPPVRQLLVKRDECCQRCGRYGVRLEAHHRRAKASGGSSARAHTQCACNGVLLCRFCHSWAHTWPRQARAEGWIVLQSVSKPATVPMLLWRLVEWQPERIGLLAVAPTKELYNRYPTCDGGWNDQP